jgi:RNA polymerase sigma factor (sigma-70 family)
MPLTEKELVFACLEDKPEAWKEFIARYQRLVFSVVFKKLRQTDLGFARHSAEEVTQDIFLYIWREKKLAQLIAHEKLASWLAMIAFHRTIDFLRSRGGRPLREEIAASSFVCEETDDDTATEGLYARIAVKRTPRDCADDAQRKKIFGEAFAALREKERLIAQFHLIDDLKYKDIARILGLTMSDVAVTLQRAKEKLRAYLKNG